MSSPPNHRKTKISAPVRRFLTTILGKSPVASGSAQTGWPPKKSQIPASTRQQFTLKPKSKSIFAKKNKFNLPVNHAASPLIKGKSPMKSKNQRSFKTVFLALILALGGGYAVYRNLFTPKVQVQTVARQWLDNSAGKSGLYAPRRAIAHPSHRTKPVRTYSCHVPRYTPKSHNLAKHSRKHRGGSKKRHLAHHQSRHGYYRTAYHGSN